MSNGSVSRLKLLGLLSDPTRLRILNLLRDDEMSVAELQEALNLGQSRISTHLGQLKESGVLQTRREGQRTYYRWSEELPTALLPLCQAALEAAKELETHDKDRKARLLILKRRKETTRQYFNTLAGRLGKKYCPGRSWEAVGHLLLQMLPPQTIADLGAGEGLLSQMLALRAKKVIAVDNSPRMVEVGTELARENGLDGLEYRLGDMEEPPIPASSVDTVILSQALHHAATPQKALDAAYRILKKGGRLLVLDLNAHTFDKARELYADTWLGFAESDLDQMMRNAGFTQISVSIVARETEAPHFQTLLAVGTK
jgi:SAM-dependent methyltransferase/biotin operon repressor